jgi:zinc transport system ATP-binding protein
MSEELITVKKLNYTVNNKPILKDISLSIQRGDYIGLIGPNGAGKTTLVKAILRLITATRGKIIIKPDIQIGYVAQRAAERNDFFPASVKEIIRNSSFNQKLDTQDYKKILQLTGIHAIENEIYSELSGGQKQRVIIARSLINKPDILILDEPTTGVDVEQQEKLYNLLRQLNTQGISIILISHDIDVVAREVKNIICLNQTLLYNCPSSKLDKTMLNKMYGENYLLVNHNH